MSIWDEIKEGASKVANTVGKKFNEVADQASTELKIMKIKRAVSLLESEINEIEGKMGKRVYDLHRHDKIEDRELRTFCFEIDELRKRIDENEEEIERIRREEEEAGARAEEAGDAGTEESNDPEDSGRPGAAEQPGRDKRGGHAPDKDANDAPEKDGEA